jgi:hypothetical protein
MLGASSAAAQLPPADIPDVCQQLDTVQINANTGTDWNLADRDTPLLVAGTDSARVYVPTSPQDTWVCKTTDANGQPRTYVRAGVFGVYETTSATEMAVMERISADRTSPFYVGVYDHPARYAAATVIAKYDSTEGVRWADLPTDSLWAR